MNTSNFEFNVDELGSLIRICKEYVKRIPCCEGHLEEALRFMERFIEAEEFLDKIIAADVRRNGEP